MVSLRKFGGGLTALALCFLLTGFISGGEKPQDCITAMVKAIESNDSKVFAERVPISYAWSARTGLAEDHEFFGYGGVSLHKKILDAVADGSLVSSCLKIPSVRFPWFPEVLKAATVSEPGTGTEEGTATASYVLPSGAIGALGLELLENKWVVVTVGSNKQSALDAIEQDRQLIAKKKEMERREAPLATCIEDILATVKIALKPLTVKHTYYKMSAELQADVTNTGTKPCRLDDIQWIFTDKNGKVTLQCDAYGSRLPVLQPNKPVRMNIEETLSRSSTRREKGSLFSFKDEAMLYWLERVRDGEATLSIRAKKIQVGDVGYTRDEFTALERIHENTDGTWQLDDFPAVKPRAVAPASMPKEDEAALVDILLKRMGEEDAKLAQIKDTILKQITVEFDSAKKDIIVHNALPKGVYIGLVRLEAHEDGVETGRDITDVRIGIKANSSASTHYYRGAFPAGSTIQGYLLEMSVGPDSEALTRADWGVQISTESETALLAGVLPPFLYQDDPVLFTLTPEQMAGTAPAAPAQAPKTEAPKAEAPAEAPKAETPKAETPKAETPKAETPKAEAPAETPKTETPKAETPTTGVTASGAVTATDTPTSPEGKNSGKAVLGVTTLDFVGQDKFGPDGKPDSAIRVSVKNPSPLVAVRIDNIGGSMASWKTSGVKTSAKGVIAVLRDGKPLNADNAIFSLDVTAPVVLDLLVQDTGVIAEGKTRLRAVFHHQDGKRSYAILEAANK